jgi:hypothetical protein
MDNKLHEYNEKEMNGIESTRKKIGEIILGLLVFILGMASCTYHTYEYVEPETPDTVSFSNDIITIFDQRCNNPGCHSSGGIPPDLTESRAYIDLTFGGYVDTANAEASELYRVINAGGSMENYATDQDRALILKWIEQGAQNN